MLRILCYCKCIDSYIVGFDAASGIRQKHRSFPPTYMPAKGNFDVVRTHLYTVLLNTFWNTLTFDNYGFSAYTCKTSPGFTCFVWAKCLGLCFIATAICNACSRKELEQILVWWRPRFICHQTAHSQAAACRTIKEKEDAHSQPYMCRIRINLDEITGGSVPKYDSQETLGFRRA